ncbi:MAG: glutamine-hydrolyzing carbamoyl-phosphate synthase small subunit [Methylococcales bacterium]|nr:glutamine-hydrolyzing carbamoyl-phosphate synthase small subunit [Methylococcales bacterium]MBT7411116.1 glutamine-hydrolyzing carbamoyl-phosphate synthase small subunit [Methylococcales bacterium]
MKNTALLALEDGSLFWGESVGADGQSAGEVVFNTSMSGYQEILTDPSYCKQIVALTYPHIGNVGINEDDFESTTSSVSGFVIRDSSMIDSNWRSQKTLREFLIEQNIIAIAGIDTRRLTRILRKKGSQNACIVTGDDIDANQAIQSASEFTGLKGLDLAQEVTTDHSYEWNQSVWDINEKNSNKTLEKEKFHVVAYDFGVKKNILRLLVDRGCRMTVVPAKTTVAEILSLKPDGVFLSNGPGDPEPCGYAIESIQQLLEKQIPMFGICLGHQLLSLASGAKTMKMKFGHHGANHPVIDLATKKVMISSQNHGFAVSETDLPDNIEVTHRSLFDDSIQGIRRTDKKAFGFQGHPEASPGPHDVVDLFDQFISSMEK